MNKAENTFKKYLFRIMGTRWDAQSIEDSLSEGVPDLAFAIEENGWIELKHLARFPIRSSTKVRFKRFTKEQVSFLVSKGRRTGRTFLMVKVGGTTNARYFIFDWTTIRAVKMGVTTAEFQDLAIRVWYKSICPDELKRILERKYEKTKPAENQTRGLI